MYLYNPPFFVGNKEKIRLINEKLKVLRYTIMGLFRNIINYVGVLIYYFIYMNKINNLFVYLSFAFFQLFFFSFFFGNKKKEKIYQ